MSDKNYPPALANESRRQAMVTVAIAFGGLALGSTMVQAETDDGISHTAEAIHQEPVIRASRQRVYEGLTDAKQFEKVIQLSGVMQTMKLGDKPAEISREVGGPFTLFRWIHHGTACRACAQRTHRAGLASWWMACGHLFDCEVRTGGAGFRDQDRIRPYGFSQRRGRIPGFGMESTLLGAA